MTSKAAGLTIDVSDNRREFFKKFFPTALFGGVASVLLLYYTNGNEETKSILLKRFGLGCLLYPASRFVIDFSYSILANQHFSSETTVIVFSGMICGFLLGSQGSKPHQLISALSFVLGGFCVDEFLKYHY